MCEEHNILRLVRVYCFKPLMCVCLCPPQLYVSEDCGRANESNYISALEYINHAYPVSVTCLVGYSLPAYSCIACNFDIIQVDCFFDVVHCYNIAHTE